MRMHDVLSRVQRGIEGQQRVRHAYNDPLVVAAILKGQADDVWDKVWHNEGSLAFKDYVTQLAVTACRALIEVCKD